MDVLYLVSLFCLIITYLSKWSSAEELKHLFRVKRGGYGGHRRCGYFRAISHDFCKGKYAGHYPHPDRACYIQCDQWGYAYVKPCAYGTFWAGGYSDYPSKFNKCVSYKYGRYHYSRFGRGHGYHGRDHHGHGYYGHGIHGHGHYGRGHYG